MRALLAAVMLAPLWTVEIDVSAAQQPTPVQVFTPTPAPSPTPYHWVWWWDNPDALSTILSTNKARYKLGDDILVKIQVTNTSTEPIVLNFPGAVLDYDLYITHDNTVMKPSPLGLRDGCILPFSGRPWGPILSPRQTAVECGTKGDFTPIRGWGLNITTPGVYYLVAISVEIEQHNAFSKGQLSNLNQLSNIVEIRVDPK